MLLARKADARDLASWAVNFDKDDTYPFRDDLDAKLAAPMGKKARAWALLNQVLGRR